MPLRRGDGVATAQRPHASIRQVLCYSTIHGQATTELYMCLGSVSGGLMSDSLVFFQSNGKQWHAWVVPEFLEMALSQDVS